MEWEVALPIHLVAEVLPERLVHQADIPFVIFWDLFEVPDYVAAIFTQLFAEKMVEAPVPEIPRSVNLQPPGRT